MRSFYNYTQIPNKADSNIYLECVLLQLIVLLISYFPTELMYVHNFVKKAFK